MKILDRHQLVSERLNRPRVPKICAADDIGKSPEMELFEKTF